MYYFESGIRHKLGESDMVEITSIVTPNPKTPGAKSDDTPDLLELTQEQRVDSVSSPSELKKKQLEKYAPQIKELLEFLLDRMIVYPTEDSTLYGFELETGDGLVVKHPQYDEYEEWEDQLTVSDTESCSEGAMKFILANAAEQLRSAGWNVSMLDEEIEISAPTTICGS